MKHTKKLWALVLALVMVLALGVTAWATESVVVPGGNPLGPGNEPTTVTDDVPFTKKVELAGAGTTPAATFTFELTDPNGRSLSDCGIAVSNNTVTLAENETSKETAFTVTVVDASTIMQTWDPDGTGRRKEFSLTEKNDGEDGWTYDSNSVTVVLMYDDTAKSLSHNREGKVFTNVYTPAAPTTTIKIPFTKVVKLGGNREPGSQSFELEIFNIGNSNTSEYANVTYTAKVETKGAGNYNGEIVITGPENEVAQYTSEGFYVREKNTGADKWTYSNAVWHVNPDVQNGFVTYSATKQTTPNGDYYEDGDAAAMTFTNVYTLNTAEVRIPFTKVVKLGGNTEPGKQTFELEIFDIGNRNTGEYADVTYTANVTTNGAGNYNGEIVITGPEDQLEQFTCEGFYVREKNTGADKWTYSNAVWHVNPDLQNRLITYPATKQTTPNGDHYEDGDAAAMTFTNVYTRNHRNITPSDPTPDEQFVSPKTFDAGIGIYAVSALLSVTGGAWLVGKKHK